MKTTEYIFHNQEHKGFYEYYTSKCSSQDSHYKALFYCLGVDGNTRNHVHEIYDCSTGCIKTGSLDAPWQTSSSRKITRLAFSLYTDGTPSVMDFDYLDAQLDECSEYSVAEIMSCGYLAYMLEAVRIRYEEYL